MRAGRGSQNLCLQRVMEGICGGPDALFLPIVARDFTPCGAAGPALLPVARQPAGHPPAACGPPPGPGPFDRVIRVHAVLGIEFPPVPPLCCRYARCGLNFGLRRAQSFAARLLWFLSFRQADRGHAENPPRGATLRDRGDIRQRPGRPDGRRVFTRNRRDGARNGRTGTGRAGNMPRRTAHRIPRGLRVLIIQQASSDGVIGPTRRGTARKT